MQKFSCLPPHAGPRFVAAFALQLHTRIAPAGYGSSSAIEQHRCTQGACVRVLWGGRAAAFAEYKVGLGLRELEDQLAKHCVDPSEKDSRCSNQSRPNDRHNTCGTCWRSLGDGGPSSYANHGRV